MSELTSKRALFLGFTIPEKIAVEIFDLDSIPAVQTHKFAWSFARSLSKALDVLLLASTCPIQNYPLGRRIIFRRSSFLEDGIPGVLLGFLNLPILKHMTRLLSCSLFLPKMIRVQKINWIFIHGIHTPFLLFGRMASLFGIKIAVVLTDPPGMLMKTDGLITRTLKRVDSYFIQHLIIRSDLLVVLAPLLLKEIGYVGRHVTFPGILNARFAEECLVSRAKSRNQKFTLVYAGGLFATYGVDKLIDAVLSITEFQISARFFGRGDQEQRIKDLASSDDRFFYGGFVDTTALIPQLKNADVLVNPRPATQGFSALSFPSKLIEYLAVGRPVLTTRIASIPIHYEDYFYFIEKADAEGIKDAICKVHSIDETERDAKADRASLFIRQEATEDAISGKLNAAMNSII